MTSQDRTQWLGCTVIILGHVLNAVGPAAYPFNILAFTAGTLLFGYWAILTNNAAQVTVNLVSFLACAVGLIRSQL